MLRPPRLASLATCLLALSGAAWGQWHSAASRHLAAGNCERAVAALELDLKEPDPPTLLLAGWLSQWGYCIERNGDSAWTFYERAQAAGEPSAALRLTGLAATTAGGSDVAAVLWWARQAQGNRTVELGDCDPFPGEPDVREPAFVERLKTWTQGRLLRCRAEIGYRALVIAELLYPVQARRRSAEGSIRLHYDLQGATSRVVPLSEGVADELVRHVEEVARRALQDMPRVPAPLTGAIEIVFKLR